MPPEPLRCQLSVAPGSAQPGRWLQGPWWHRCRRRARLQGRGSAPGPGLFAVPLSAKQDSGFVGRNPFLEKERSGLRNEEDCLALLFWVLIFFAFFYLNANMTSCPFIFYTALVFPIPSALEAAERMQFLFSFAEEMMIPVPWKMFSLDGWGVCMCEVPKAAREGPFPISDSLAIKQPL